MLIDQVLCDKKLVSAFDKNICIYTFFCICEKRNYVKREKMILNTHTHTGTHYFVLNIKSIYSLLFWFYLPPACTWYLPPLYFLHKIQKNKILSINSITCTHISYHIYTFSIYIYIYIKINKI